MMRSDKTELPITLDDYEEAARTRLNAMAYEYIASGSADDFTLRRNREAFQQIEIMPRVLVDVSRIDTRTTLFGREHAFPILLAPTGYHKLFHPEGELETVRGANVAGATLVGACFATTVFEAMQQASQNPLWFQLYIHPDRGYTKELLDRVIAAGCEAICVTVDFPVNAPRDRERRVHFELPSGMVRENLLGLGTSAASAPHHVVGNDIYNAVRAADATWKDIEWLRSILNIPLLLKGVARADDAQTAASLGCDSVIVSNHGGRSLDSTPASLDLLPAIADRIGDRATILMDGGIRRGTDVLKSLACGADAVMIGRPYLYGLSVHGASGIANVVNILRTEFEMAMGLAGCARLDDIDKSLLLVRS